MVLPADAGAEASLFGREGELISVRVTVEPRLLEDLLDALALLDFPVNPQLYHHTAEVAVEFPAYSSQLDRVRQALRARGFNDEQVELSKVLARSQH
jgi:glutamine synthetase adenylyltransferase